MYVLNWFILIQTVSLEREILFFSSTEKVIGLSLASLIILLAGTLIPKPKCDLWLLFISSILLAYMYIYFCSATVQLQA